MTLIRGLHEADQGDVYLDGAKMPSMKVLSHLTTLIPQEPEIFENTIEYNIAAGISHTPEEIQTACQLARFEPVLTRLPHGLQTSIKEKGVNLSGGEKQRLALARGVFAAKLSSIILMDEPTSSVDTANERAIYQNLFDYFADRCVISSMHRLHLLPMFDEIYVMRSGKVVERGHFNELIAADGLLKQMWEKYQLTEKHSLRA